MHRGHPVHKSFCSQLVTQIVGKMESCFAKQAQGSPEGGDADGTDGLRWLTAEEKGTGYHMEQDLVRYVYSGRLQSEGQSTFVMSTDKMDGIGSTLVNAVVGLYDGEGILAVPNVLWISH